jgi:hypothetical protein
LTNFYIFLPALASSDRLLPTLTGFVRFLPTLVGFGRVPVLLVLAGLDPPTNQFDQPWLAVTDLGLLWPSLTSFNQFW